MRAQIAERLMETTLVVPADLSVHRRPRSGTVGEVVLPDVLLFQAAEEALDDAVLLRRVGRDVLLRETVVAAAARLQFDAG